MDFAIARGHDGIVGQLDQTLDGILWIPLLLGPFRPAREFFIRVTRDARTAPEPSDATAGRIVAVAVLDPLDEPEEAAGLCRFEEFGVGGAVIEVQTLDITTDATGHDAEPAAAGEPAPHEPGIRALFLELLPGAVDELWSLAAIFERR